MNTLFPLWHEVVRRLDRAAPSVAPSLARLVFAGVLLVYFLTSFATKLGPGPFGFLQPGAGAFIQIYPRLFDAAGYDPGQLGLVPHLVVIAGTIAEALLPILITIGLFTRPAALAMIGFVAMQSLTDIYGHGIGGDDLGGWFDAASGSLILDQRAFWVLLLAILVFMGAGPLSLDRIATRTFGRMR